jgi:hypothetical protein
MGTFHVGCKIENHLDRQRPVTVPGVLVDSGSEYTWIPAKTLEKIRAGREKKDLVFTMANGQTITRSVGFAILEPGDLTLLGAHPGGIVPGSRHAA